MGEPDSLSWRRQKWLCWVILFKVHETCQRRDSLMEFLPISVKLSGWPLSSMPGVTTFSITPSIQLEEGLELLKSSLEQEHALYLPHCRRRLTTVRSFGLQAAVDLGTRHF